MRIMLFIFILLASFPASGFKEFHQVASGIYRGNQPDTNDFDYLKLVGVRTIVDLNDKPDELIHEQMLAARRDIKVISVPLNGFWAPEQEDVDRALAAISDEKNWPVYVHCEHGHDRTGLLIGLYRVKREGKNPGVAWHEMLDQGYHPLLLGLSWYWFWNTSRPIF